MNFYEIHANKNLIFTYINNVVLNNKFKKNLNDIKIFYTYRTIFKIF